MTAPGPLHSTFHPRGCSLVVQLYPSTKDNDAGPLGASRSLLGTCVVVWAGRARSPERQHCPGGRSAHISWQHWAASEPSGSSWASPIRCVPTCRAACKRSSATDSRILGMPECQKKPYPTLPAAVIALHAIRKAQVKRGRTGPTGAYWCRSCRQFHLTSKSSTRLPPWRRTPGSERGGLP